MLTDTIEDQLGEAFAQQVDAGVEARKHADRDGRVSREDRFRFDFKAADAPDPPKTLDNGMVELWGVATRANAVFLYDDPNMPEGVCREFRPRDEILNPESLATLVGVPFTIDHPQSDVTTQNAQGLTHGWVLAVKEIGDLVWVKIRLATASVLSKVASGIVELSCGYTAELEWTSGYTISGEKFDAIQRGVVYNHLALVDAARAGPVAKLKLDGGTRVSRRDRQGPSTMKIFTIKTDSGKTIKAPAFLLRSFKDAHDEQAKRKDQVETVHIVAETAEGKDEFILPANSWSEFMAMIGAQAPAEPEIEPAPGDEIDPELPEGGQDAEAPVAAAEEEDPMKPKAFADAFAKHKADTEVALKKVKADAAKEAEKIVARKDAEAKRRADVERRAAPILGESFAYADSDVWGIAHAAIAKVDEASGKDLEASLKTARDSKADPVSRGDAQGMLLGCFRAALKEHTAKADRSGDVAKFIFPREDDTATPKGRVDSARDKYLARISGKKSGAEAGSAA